MAEIFTPLTLSSLANASSAINVINSNFTTLSTLLNDVLSRSGVSPNQMGSTLDMNSNQIINLPFPNTPNSPIRLVDTTTPVTPPGSILAGNNVWTGTNSFNSTVSIPQFFANVKAFGAVGDGSTNDTTAIQNAINSLASTGGTVFFPAGTYVVSATLTITTADIHLVGVGNGGNNGFGSEIYITSVMSTDIIKFSGTYLGGGVKNLCFQFFSTPTGGSAINIGNGNPLGRVTIADCSMFGPYNGINVNQSTGGGVRINNVDISHSVNDGILISATESCWIDGVQTFQSPVGGGAGLHMTGSGGGMGIGGVQVSNCYFTGNSNGVLINPNTGQTVLDLWLVNVDCDSCTATGFTIDTSAGSGIARNIHCLGLRCGFANNGSTTAGRGIYIAGSGSTDITFSGGECVRNVQEGIYIHGGTDIRIVNMLVLGNSVQGLNSWHNINIDGGNKVTIIGGSSGPYNDGNANNENYGLVFQGSFTGQGTVIGLDVTGNNNTIFPGGTNTKILDCIGYNPVGVSGPTTMGASPFTYTAGPTPETHYVNQSATNTATITKGGKTVATLAGTSTYYTVELGPNDSYITTWSTTAPTYTKDIH